MAGGTILEVQGLECKFGGLLAVASFDMQVAEGRITALIGPNGAGKSTVINLLSGFLRPTSGHVILKGRDVTRQPTIGARESRPRAHVPARPPVQATVGFREHASRQQRERQRTND